MRIKFDTMNKYKIPFKFYRPTQFPIRGDRKRREEKLIGARPLYHHWHALHHWEERGEMLPMSLWRPSFRCQWTPYVPLEDHRSLSSVGTCIASAALFSLPIYHSFYNCFIFNFDLLTLDCFKLAKFYFICKIKHRKLPSILQELHIKAIITNYQVKS